MGSLGTEVDMKLDLNRGMSRKRFSMYFGGFRTVAVNLFMSTAVVAK